MGVHFQLERVKVVSLLSHWEIAKERIREERKRERERAREEY